MRNILQVIKEIVQGSKKSSYPYSRFACLLCSAHKTNEKLNKELLVWTDVTMKEERFTIPVDIICGRGNQICAEAVDKWIHKKRQVANSLKGFA